MLINPSAIFLISLLCFAQYSSAAIQKTIFDVSSLPVEEQNNSAKVTEYQQRRFRQYEDNSLIWDYFNGDKLDNHLDAKLSVTYLIFNPNRVNSEANGDWNAAFSATVEFDFYMGTRHSGPVVGRRYNPGIQVYKSYYGGKGWQELRFSVEHESNGQSTESIQTLDRITNDFLAEYQEDNIDFNTAQRFAEETISMGNNFVSVGGVYRFKKNASKAKKCDETFRCFDFHFKLRDNTIITSENSGNFRSLEAHDQNLSDYQGISLSYFSRANLIEQHDIALELNYITGQINGGSPGKHNTFKAAIYYNWQLYNDQLTVPLVASCHTGYVHDLYNFAQKKSECTLGFHFIY